MWPAIRTVACAGLGVAAVTIATAVLRATDADLTFAAVSLLLVVVGASVLGLVAGVATALAATAALTYSFTPPVHSFTIARADDVLALAAFVTVALVVSTLVARLSELRRRADLAARVAHFRSELVNELAGGAPTAGALDALANELVEVYDLDRCAVVSASGRTVVGTGDGAVVQEAQAGDLRVVLEASRPLSADDLTTIEALVASVSTAIDRARLDHEARAQRLRHDLDRSRVGFLTAVTHDLRTPLATIKAATGVLLTTDGRVDADARRDLLGAAYTEASRLERLVTNVIELSRVRSGALAPVPVPTDVSDLAAAGLRRLGRLCTDRPITFAVDPAVPAVVVDPLQLEIVLGNLLENAIRHDPTRRPVTVAATACDEAVELCVVDHGPGIPAPDRERVFDEFVRLEASEGTPGSGLGLAIVRALVEANGGRVRYRDTAGGGATFALTLPAEPDAPVNGAAAPAEVTVR